VLADTRLNQEFSKGKFKSILFETDARKASKDARVGISLNKHSYYTGEEAVMKILLNNKKCSYGVGAVEIQLERHIEAKD
jgi:hypothetical protein